MPAKWQQWLPFKIDAFRSSPAVQAMHPCARAGYLYLLACAWQTEDCTLPSDPIDLAEMSGLGDELWKIHGPRILRKFGTDPDGRLLNFVLFDEWKEAKRVFESRQNAADRTNKHRWSNGHRSVTDKGASRSADTRTGTVTETGTKTETRAAKTKTLARSVPPDELAGTLPLVDGSAYSISKTQVSEWREAYPAIDVKIELKKFKAWLDANPTRKKTGKGIARAIVNWLGRAQDKGPSLLNGSNGHGQVSSAELREQRRSATFAEAERILAAEKSSGASRDARGRSSA